MKLRSGPAFCFAQGVAESELPRRAGKAAGGLAMAHVFRKPGKKAWWACDYVGDKRVRHSQTIDERVALTKLKKIELDLLTGELQPKSGTPVTPFLEAFCTYLATVHSAEAEGVTRSPTRGAFPGRVS
jgi:hypothetical protein